MSALTDRLAELKAVAENATPGPWTVEETKESGEYGDYLVHGVHPIATAQWYPDSAYAHTALDDMAVGDATHVATFSPPTVLALIAALEGVLEVHRPIDALNIRVNKIAQVCLGCGTDDGNWQQYPCPTVRAVAEALEVEL